MIETIVGTEAPVHPTIVFERVKEAFDMASMTMRYRSYLSDRVRGLERRKELVRDSDGFLRLDDTTVRPRVPTSDPRTARKADYVSPDEVGEVFVLVVREAGGVEEQEAIRTVARLFGWRRVSQNMRAHLGKSLRRRISAGDIDLESGPDGQTILVPPT